VTLGLFGYQNCLFGRDTIKSSNSDKQAVPDEIAGAAALQSSPLRAELENVRVLLKSGRKSEAEKILISLLDPALKAGDSAKVSSIISYAHSQGWFDLEDRAYESAARHFVRDINWNLRWSKSLIDREQFARAAQTLSACAKNYAQTAPDQLDNFLKGSFAQVQSLDARKRYTEALAYLDDALKLRPKNASLHQLRAWTLWYLDRPAGALVEISKAIELSPNNTKELQADRMSFRWHLWVDRKPLTLFLKAIKQDGENADCHYVEAIKLFQSQKPAPVLEQALEQIEIATKANPSDTDYLYFKARILFQLNKRKEALETIDNAIRLEPRKVRLLLTKSGFLQTMGKFDEARVPITRAIQLEPNNAYNHVGMAGLYNAMNKRAECLQEIDRAIALDPKPLDYHQQKIQYLLTFGRPDLALKEIEQLIRATPQDPALHARKAEVLDHLKEYDKALEETSLAIKLNPQGAGYYHQRCELLQKSNVPASASDIAMALKLNPSDLFIRSFYVDWLCDQGKLDAAASYLSNWLKASGTSDCDYINHGAQRLLEGGDAKRGLELLTKAIERFPNNGPLYASRAVAYCILKDTAGAVKDANVSLNCGGDSLGNCDRLVSLIPHFKPYTVAHAVVLDQVIEAIEQLEKTARTKGGDLDTLETLKKAALENIGVVVSIVTTGSKQERDHTDLEGQVESAERVRRLPECLFTALAGWYARSNNYPEAFATVSRGLKVYPKSLKLLETKATLETALGHNSAALQDVRRVQKAGSTSFTVDSAKAGSRKLMLQYPSFASSYGAAGNEALNSALKEQQDKLASLTNPHERAAVLLKLGQIDIAAKNYSRALQYLDEAIKLGGNRSLAYELSSWAYEGLEKHEQAREARRMAVILYKKP
jgi:tetratricopeptide (TPR) repeat protein